MSNRDNFLHKKMAKINSINMIVDLAEKAIFLETGERKRLLVMEDISKEEFSAAANNEPHKMVDVIAASVGLTASELRTPNRRRELVMARQVTTVFLRMYYPSLSYKTIGELLGGQDHTTVINSLKVSEQLKSTGNSGFMFIYSKALDAVTQWVME